MKCIGGIRIFWGLLIILLEIRYKGFDLFPDVIGFFLIYNGLGSLPIVEHPSLKRARLVSVVLIFVSLVFIYQPKPIQLLNSVFPFHDLWIVLIIQVRMWIELLLVQWMCRGMEEMAERREFPSLASVVRARRRGYQISTLAVLFITPLLLHSEMVASFLLVVPVYSSTLFLLLIAFSFRRMEKEMAASIG